MTQHAHTDTGARNTHWRTQLNVRSHVISVWEREKGTMNTETSAYFEMMGDGVAVVGDGGDGGDGDGIRMVGIIYTHIRRGVCVYESTA